MKVQNIQIINRAGEFHCIDKMHVEIILRRHDEWIENGWWNWSPRYQIIWDMMLAGF